jgi:hypothetical protein
MNTNETGGPAFPTEAYDLERQTMVREEGMTLRDYFAAKAMQALLTSETKFSSDLMMYAGAAYDVADAMLQERNK